MRLVKAVPPAPKCAVTIAPPPATQTRVDPAAVAGMVTLNEVTAVVGLVKRVELSSRATISLRPYETVLFTMILTVRSEPATVDPTCNMSTVR